MEYLCLNSVFLTLSECVFSNPSLPLLFRLSTQSPAFIAPESRRQRADEFCIASRIPRTQQTPPPPSPHPTTPPLLSPPTPPALRPLTTGFAPPLPGRCSPPAVWGPARWARQRQVTEGARPSTGSGWAAAHRASPREPTGGSLNSARGHSSWFCTAATSSWCEAKEGRNAGHRLWSTGGWARSGRRESPGMDEAGHGARFMPNVDCCPSSVLTPLLPWSSQSRKLWGLQKTGRTTQRDKTTKMVKDWRLMWIEGVKWNGFWPSDLSAVWPLLEHQGSVKGEKKKKKQKKGRTGGETQKKKHSCKAKSDSALSSFF